MLKTLSRLALISLSALLVGGCWLLPIPAKSAPAPPGLPRNMPPTPSVPEIHLEYAGGRVTGVDSYFTWKTGNSSFGGGGVQTGTPGGTLTLQTGASLDIVITHSAPPAALWIAELDPGGVPVKSAALTPASNVNAYTPGTTGKYKLQVTAEWTYQNYVTYVFELDVRP